MSPRSLAAGSVAQGLGRLQGSWIHLGCVLEVDAALCQLQFWGPRRRSAEAAGFVSVPNPVLSDAEGLSVLFLAQL